MRPGAALGAAAAAIMAVAFSGGGGDLVSAAPSAVPAAAAAPALDPSGGACGVDGLSEPQARIARAGVAAADRAGVGDNGAVIVIAAGIVESDLRDLDHGDRDSIGWLQQRPSQGWANAADPARAGDDFFAALQRVDGWQRMAPGDAAQAVQASAHPARYARQADRARSIVAAVRKGCPAAPVAAPATATGRAKTALAWAQTQVGKPYRMGANGPDAWDCSSFSREAMRQAGVTGMPRTAQTQRDWCAAGNCTRIPEGQEKPGDLGFWDSYLGPNKVGHVVLIRDPSNRGTTDARGSKQGVINGTYKTSREKNILEFWRPHALGK